jgi:hypothetical protein
MNLTMRQTLQTRQAVGEPADTTARSMVAQQTTTGTADGVMMTMTMMISQAGTIQVLLMTVCSQTLQTRQLG